MPLRGMPGTAEFQAAYDSARLAFEGERTADDASSPARLTAGSLRWLCVEYQRRSDVVLFGKQHLHARTLRFTQQEPAEKAGLARAADSAGAAGGIRRQSVGRVDFPDDGRGEAIHRC